jgi:hypothetical protein
VDRAIAQVISDSNKLRAVVAIFERVINSAFDQKLAPGALSVDVLDTIVHHIKDTAAKNKFHNFVHQPSDLYKLETSFIHRPEESTVILILHVPYVETENLLPLYEFISLPIYFNFSSNVSVLPDVGKQDLIVIGNTEAFQTLSSSDLANCKRMGKTFFCEGRSVLQTNIVNDCLGSLYLGSSTLIKNNCKFRIATTREKIYSLGNNTWLVYSIGTIATNQVCPKTNTLSPLTIKSGQQIQVAPGCNVPTMDHLISANDSEETDILNSWLDWTMSLPELFNHENTVQLTAMIKDIRKHVTGDFDASHLLKQLDHVQKPFSADHWRFSSPAVMLGTALLLAVVAVVIWRKCCAQPSQTASTTGQPEQQPPAPKQEHPPPQVQVIQHQHPLVTPPPPAYQVQNLVFQAPKPTNPVLIYS